MRITVGRRHLRARTARVLRITVGRRHLRARTVRAVRITVGRCRHLRARVLAPRRVTTRVAVGRRWRWITDWRRRFTVATRRDEHPRRRALPLIAAQITRRLHLRTWTGRIRGLPISVHPVPGMRRRLRRRIRRRSRVARRSRRVAGSLRGQRVTGDRHLSVTGIGRRRSTVAWGRAVARRIAGRRRGGDRTPVRIARGGLIVRRRLTRCSEP